MLLGYHNPETLSLPVLLGSSEMTLCRLLLVENSKMTTVAENKIKCTFLNSNVQQQNIHKISLQKFSEKQDSNVFKGWMALLS